jgi:hypothetical protein
LRRLFFFVASASVLLFLVLSPGIANAYLGPPVTCYLATQPVTIDGKWTTKTEWNDTAETKLLVGSGALEGYFRIKHDSSWLYVLVDVPGDTQVEYSVAKDHGDYAQIFFDPLYNDGSKPRTDDYKYAAWYNTTGGTDLVAREWAGTDWGANWWSSTSDLDATIGMDNGNSPHSPSPHVVVEFRVPLSIIKGTTFGFFIRYVDSTEADALHWYWPGPTAVDQEYAPNTWGTVNLSNIAVPEFSSSWLIAAATVLMVLALNRAHKKKRPD